jgi:citrate lyase subunit beta/citryl-CoA lyase
MRSVLFVPGDRPERFEKAFASGADVIVIDLEDAVLPEGKSHARELVRSSPHKARSVIVRTNSVGSEWFSDDLLMLRDAGYRAMMLPKTQSAGDLDAVLSVCGPGLQIYPLIETVKGVVSQREIASHSATERLIFGSVDFSKDSGIMDEAGWLPFRVEMVIASKLAGLKGPIDGTLLGWDNPDYLTQQAAISRGLGFAGRLCIHPAQVIPVNQGMLASATQIDWAKRVVGAFENSMTGAIVVDNKLVDKPVYELAREWLSQLPVE